MLHYMKSLCLILLSPLFSMGLFGEPVGFYLADRENDGVFFASLDPDDGSLTEPRKVAEVRNTGFIAIHPTKPVLYATQSITHGEKGSVVAFRIEDDRSLTKLNEQSSEGLNPVHLSVDKTGKVLLVANYSGDQSVAAMRINEDGSLEPSVSQHNHEGSGTHPKRQKGPHPHSIYPNPSNSYAYVPDLGIDKIVIYEINPEDATLTPSGSVIVPGGGKGPRHMKFTNDGTFAYVLNELSLDVSVFSVHSETGEMEFIESVEILEEGINPENLTCSEIRMHPNGKFIYGAVRDSSGSGRDRMGVFTRNQNNGRIHLLETIPAGVSVPRNFNIDPSGQWLLVGGAREGGIMVITINPKTGRLQSGTMGTSNQVFPICIEFFHN